MQLTSSTGFPSQLSLAEVSVNFITNSQIVNIDLDHPLVYISAAATTLVVEDLFALDDDQVYHVCSSGLGLLKGQQIKFRKVLQQKEQNQDFQHL